MYQQTLFYHEDTDKQLRTIRWLQYQTAFREWRIHENSQPVYILQLQFEVPFVVAHITAPINSNLTHSNLNHPNSSLVKRCHRLKLAYYNVNRRQIRRTRIIELKPPFFDSANAQLFRLMRFHTIFILLSALWAVSLSQDYHWNDVQDTVEYYRANGAFVGGVLRVANGTHTIYEYPFGHYTNNQLPFSSRPFTNDTIFDLASLTKVTATLTCIMHLYEEGKVGIDDPVTKFIPEYANHGKQPTTVRNLLLHNAGLLPDYPGTLPSTKQQVMSWTYNCSLDYPIGTKFVYSDLSFILLGEISERVSKKPLEVYSRELMQQMGMPNSTYLPNLESLLHRIAPAEYSPFRKTLIRGAVHDPTAYLFGGVAGHAGFFSIAEDLQTYMQIHLNRGLHRNGTRVYNATTVDTFYKREDGLPYTNRRALGWDTVPIQTYPPCGTLFSMNSFGHTGYTGTSIWADRDKNLIVVLLTNRVYPTDRNNFHIEARSKITDAVVRALRLQ